MSLCLDGTKHHRPAERCNIARRIFSKDGRFPAFFDFFDDLLSQKNNSCANVNVQKPLTYTDACETADLLKSHPQMTREETIQKLYEVYSLALPKSKAEKMLNLAVQIMIMVDCDAQLWHAPDYTLGSYRPTSWYPKETYLDFVSCSFPARFDSSRELKMALDDRAAMKAWKLQKRIGVDFRPTNNLAEHLLYDPHNNCIYLFHHAGFLKAQLEKHQTRESPLEMGVMECLESGTLPVQLLFETLHSLQGILFQRSDKKSGAILEKLTTRRHGYFDPECAVYEGYKVFVQPPADFTYKYWGERMAILRELLMSRPPRNKLERWLHWQSSEGNALFVALLALLISILVGIVSIGLAAFQAWIAWMAWKHPVCN